MSHMNEFAQFYDNIGFTKDQKARIVENTLKQFSDSNRKTYTNSYNVCKFAALVACFFCVLTLTAEASGIRTPLSDLLGPLFGGHIAQTEVIESLGRPVSASDTDNGVTVSAEAILGDKYNACLVFCIKRENGKPILPEGVDVRMLQINGFSDIDFLHMGGSHGASRFVDLEPKDGEIHYLKYFSSDHPLNKGTVKASFEDLYAYSDQEGNTKKILEGKWNVRFQVDYEDSSIKLGNGESFEQAGICFTINEIMLSPIGVNVFYETDADIVWTNADNGRLPDEDRREIERNLEHIPLILTKKDGCVIDLTWEAGGGIRPENGKTYCNKGTVFEEILPLDQIDSICVGGIEFSIE